MTTIKKETQRPSTTTRVHARHALNIAIRLGLVLAAMPAFAERGSPDGRFCSATSKEQFKACGFGTLDDFYIARVKCINISDPGARGACFDTARQKRDEGKKLCRDQLAARLEICGELGEARYDPEFNPVDFDDDYHLLTNPNLYFPLTIGHRWDYAGSLETNTIVSLDETKLIEGVTCIVLKDKRYENDLLVEETDDWYGQRKDGTVDFCGEQVNNFETFPGDNPVGPERLSTDGQWKTGRDGDPPGTFLLGSPRVGDVHRQEFSPGSAEDTVHYLSTHYGYGSDPVLDQHVPPALIELFCGGHDCWVTSENTGLEPGELTRQYYARGVGFILGVDTGTGKTVQLVGCNFDPRCATLPTP